jgi:hypothetical protein
LRKQLLHQEQIEVLAIAQLPYGKTVAGEGIKDVMRDVHAAVAKLADRMPSQYSSTAQDLARGKRSEIDYLNGPRIQWARWCPMTHVTECFRETRESPSVRTMLQHFALKHHDSGYPRTNPGSPCMGRCAVDSSRHQERRR